MKKRVVLCLIIILAASSTFCFNYSSASSNKPPAPEFTLQTVAYPYDVPPTTTSTTDPYTGKITTTTIPGYHVENKTIEAVIKNNGASNYNFRYKGHYTDKWSYYPFEPNDYSVADGFGVPYQASASEHTIVTLRFLPENIPADGSVDIQVQGLFGTYDAIPYGHAVFVGGLTYDFIFNGTASDWSDTQTITIGATASSSTSDTSPSTSPSTSPDSSTSPSQESASPTTPDHSVNETPLETTLYGIAVTTAIVLTVSLSLLVYVKKRRRQPRANAFCYEML